MKKIIVVKSWFLFFLNVFKVCFGSLGVKKILRSLERGLFVYFGLFFVIKVKNWKYIRNINQTRQKTISKHKNSSFKIFLFHSV